MHNFVEMRDHTASQLFLWKKKFQHVLHGLFPQTFIPLYNMVSFSTIPYAQAQKRAEWQSRTLKRIGISFGAVVALLIVAIIALT